MANLETLELTINANADSASQGLKRLIDSLSSLSSKVGKCVGSLKLLNTELSNLKNNANVKFSGIDNATKNVASNAKKVKKSFEDISKLDVGNRRAVNRGAANAKPYEQWKREYDQIGEQMKAERARMDSIYAQKRSQRNVDNSPIVQQIKAYEEGNQASRHVQEYINQSLGIGSTPKSAKDSASVFLAQMKETPSFAEKAKSGLAKFKNGFVSLKNEIGKMLPKFQLLNRVMRIASTMLIRMGVKALFKGAKEGFNNFYEYSKATGGAFAQEMDGIYSSWNQIKNQLGASIATAFSAAIPVINSLANAAITAFNYLSQLIALLTGKSSWSKATAQVSDYGDAINKASGKSGGGGMKELLAQFDELNVIASESGGGGGGGAAAAAEAYENMFEEITEFDQRIRDIANFVKDVIGWIKDNIEIVLATVGAIGLAILGWKISQAFDGALATLGKILAGAALVTLGVVLDFDFGTKLGRQLAGGKAVNWGDIVEGIAGIVAAGIGGYLIGGGVGAAIGIAFAVTATIAGIMVGWKNEKDKQKWGQRSLTPEDIHRYVISQFTFDVDVEVDLINAKIKDAKQAKAKLDLAVKVFSLFLDKIKLGVDISPEAYETAKTNLDTVISDLKSYTEASENLISAYVQVMPYENSEKAGIQKDIFSANEQLNEYFRLQGEKVANLYDQGMKDGWSKNEQQMILELMEHVNNIFTGADMNRATNEAITASTLNLSGFTKETAEGILAEQKKILEEHKNTLKEASAEIANELKYYADLSDAAGLIDEASGRPLGDIYRERADQILDGFEKEYEKKLAQTKKVMKTTWLNTLRDVYGKDAFNIVTDWAGDQYSRFEKALKDSYKKGETAAKDTIKEYLGYMEQAFLDTDPIMKEASEMFGIKGWDIFSNEAKTVFVHSIYESIGVQGVALLKDSLNLSASEIMQITNWDSFSADQKVQFIDALVKAYGAGEALKVAKEAGINVKESINAGLNSNNSETRAAAQSIVKTIDDELSKVKNVQIDAEADLEVKVDALVNVVPQVHGGVVETAKAVVNTVKSNLNTVKNLFSVLTGGKKTNGAKKATGAIGIPSGEVFIANEQGAELVGSINGKTSVANQQQIIEGIASGVERANSEQNTLLRQQNELLRGILEKDASVRIGASAALGRVARQSLDMYGSMIGG